MFDQKKKKILSIKKRYFEFINTFLYCCKYSVLKFVLLCPFAPLYKSL